MRRCEQSYFIIVVCGKCGKRRMRNGGGQGETADKEIVSSVFVHVCLCLCLRVKYPSRTDRAYTLLQRETMGSNSEERFIRVNDYDVISRIGRGGMGVVYLARQRSLDRPVALKVLASHLAAEPRYVARLLREARLAARLSHPNVVRVFDVGQWRETHYIVMEYIQGRSLDRLIRSGELLSESSAVGVLLQMADVLQAARQLGIVHRDIKPGNILLASDGAVKLADFGVACVAGEAAEPDVGTPYYLSPEQARSDPLLDIRADIYSLGCTLFHAMAGRPPYLGATTIATVTMHLDSPVPDIRELRLEVSAEFAALLRRMMAKLPQDRPGPVELMEELRKMRERAAPSEDSRLTRWVGRFMRRLRRG